MGWKQEAGTLGEFQEHDTYNWFTYKRATDMLFGDEYPYLVWIGEYGGYRYANVIKTRAYVVVDEADDGSPVVEKWCLRRHHRWA